MIKPRIFILLLTILLLSTSASFADFDITPCDVGVHYYSSGSHYTGQCLMCGQPDPNPPQNNPSEIKVCDDKNHYYNFGRYYTGYCVLCKQPDPNAPQTELDKLYWALECIQAQLKAPRTMGVIKIITMGAEDNGFSFSALIDYYYTNIYGVEVVDKSLIKFEGKAYAFPVINTIPYSELAMKLKLDGHVINDKDLQKLNKLLAKEFPNIDDLIESKKILTTNK